MQDEKTIEGELVEQKPVPVSNMTAMGSAADVRAAVASMTEIRTVLDEYIRANLVEGTDYGPAYPGSSKKTLLKPGSEKMAQLFNLRAEFLRDDLTREMAGNPEKSYFFVCRLLDRQGNVWGEGRGACSEDMARKRDANSAIKIAEKRAQMDVTLRVFALSDRFTQDLEDGDYVAPAAAKPATPTPAYQTAPVPASEKQLWMIDSLLRESGLSKDKLSEWTMAQFKKPVAELTKAQASATIEKLQKRSSGEAKPPAETATLDPKAAGEIAQSAWGDKKPELPPDFMKQIEAAKTKEELSEVEGLIQLDTRMGATMRTTLLSMVEARKNNLT